MGVTHGTLGVVARPRRGDRFPNDLARLHAMGCDLLVSLLTAEENAELHLEGEGEAARRAGMAFLHIPVPDFGLPDDTPFRAAVERVGAEVDAGRSVLAHCRGGIGRSPLFVASVLVIRGEGWSRAWERVAEARRCPVPDNAAQRDWLRRVESWR